MELLGQYKFQLTNEYYQQLLVLLNSAISAGDLAGGSTFDQTSLNNLEAQAQSFAQLPTGAANSRVTDDSLNYPLSLLQARLNAIQAEVNNFTTVSGRLLDILANETVLLDQLLAADNLTQWTSTLPQLLNAWTQAWDFTISRGPQFQAASLIDPANSVIYSAELPTATIFNTYTGNVYGGLCPPNTIRTFPPKSVEWTYDINGTPQELYAPDFSWTQLDVITNEPDIDFSSPPAAQVVLPLGTSSVSAFSFTGQVPGGALPTYVRFLFYPRYNSQSMTISNGVPITLSLYNVDPNVITIISNDLTEEYQQGVDFSVNAVGGVTPIGVGTLVPVTIYFTEYWPAYQCSLDQITWSNIVMIDPDRVYPDDVTGYIPVDVETIDGISLFPLTDERGLSTGIYFQLLVPLPAEYTLLVTTPPGTVSGPSATLEVDIAKPSFMTTLSISPYCAFSMNLTNVQLQGLTANTLTSVWVGSLSLDTPTQIQFPRQIVSKIFLTLSQDNYTIKEYQNVSTDALRRNVMNAIEASLPISISNSTPSVPIVYRGYQYEWGIEDIVALDIQPTYPGVFVQGPYIINGHPDIIRLDAVTSGTVSIYVTYIAYAANGSLLDQNLNGFAITPGSSMVFPFASELSTIAKVELGLRFVLNSTDAIVTKYYLQATLQ